jgi:UDP-glucuronate 4-epimerase
LPSFSAPLKYIQSNISAFTNVLAYATDQKIQMIYASSSSVYGKSTKIPFKEEELSFDPISPYAATKLFDELLAGIYAERYAMQITGLRFFTVYGPWNRRDMAVFQFITSIIKGDTISLRNNGAMSRDFTYVGDVCHAIEKIISQAEKEEKFHRVFNIGNCNAVQVVRLIEIMEKALNKKANIQFSSGAAGEMIDTLADSSKLYQHLNWLPETAIEEGISKTITWYLSQVGPLDIPVIKTNPEAGI